MNNISKKNTTVTIGIILMVALFCFFYFEPKKKSGLIDVEKLTMLAEKGNAEAQTDLGLAYGSGNGVRKDYEKAMYWYTKSAEQDYAQAQFNLGLYYEHGWGTAKNIQLAIKWYIKAAEKNMVSAQVNLGTLYVTTTGTERNYSEGKKWLLKAAEKNNTVAMNNLGQIYAHGLGIEKDNIQAEKWYLRAVALGSMSARNSLGAFYGKGLGSHPEDVDTVLSLVEASACQGYIPAQINLASFYMGNDDEAPIDYKKSYAWYYTAYINGSVSSEYELNSLAKKMSNEELTDAKKMATEYSQKYRSSPIEDDTYKSQVECRYP